MIDRRPLTHGFLELLRTGTAMPVGRGQAPAIIAGKPWMVVHVIEGGGYDGAPLTDPTSDAAFVYQVDAVGRSEDQAEWMADVVRRTVLARTTSGAFQVPFPAVEAVKVIDRRPDTNPGGLTSEGTAPNEVFTVSDRFSIHVTPA